MYYCLLQKCITKLHVVQESHAIAKVTVQCTIYTDALDNFESAWLHPWPLFPKLLMDFC